MKCLTSLLSVIVLLLVSVRAEAVVVVSNLNEPVGSPFDGSYWGVGATTVGNVPGVYTIAYAFTTSSTSYDLTSITIDAKTNSMTPGAFTVTLAANNVGQPGAALATLSGSLNPSDIAPYNDYSPLSPVTLQANTTYHVVVSGSATTSYLWHTVNYFNTNKVGPGTLSTSVLYKY